MEFAISACGGVDDHVWLFVDGVEGGRPNAKIEIPGPPSEDLPVSAFECSHECRPDEPMMTSHVDRLFDQSMGTQHCHKTLPLPLAAEGIHVGRQPMT